MNMPVGDDGTVHFTTTLFALIRESLGIRMGPGDYDDLIIIVVVFVDFVADVVVVRSCDYVMFHNFTPTPSFIPKKHLKTKIKLSHVEV